MKGPGLFYTSKSKTMVNPIKELTGWFILLFALSMACSEANAQEKKPWDYYYTIWFVLNKPSKEFVAHYDSVKCIACDSIEYHPHSEWVQSFDDSTESYGYYHHLRSTGRVLIWGKYECGVDTNSIWIDKYSVPLHRYLKIKQP